MYHSRFKNSYYDAGFKYGSLLFDNGKSFNKAHILNLSEEKRDFTIKSIEIYKREYPEILEEIRGIADGQRMEFLDLACFILGMYNFTLENYCSCVVVKSGEDIIFGRNSDFLVELEHLYESCYYDLYNSYSFIGNTTAVTQIEDGVNEYGLAAGLTFVYPTVKKTGINAGLLIRYILEKCKTVKEGIDALKNLTISSNQTITLADKSGDMAVIECNCNEMEIIRPKGDDNAVYTTNHFNTDKMKKYNPQIALNGEDLFSYKRYEVLKDVLSVKKEYDFEFIKNLLGGKYGFMCQYDRRSGADTVWSSIYLLNKNKIYRCEGNPSRKTYKSDKRLYFK